MASTSLTKMNVGLATGESATTLMPKLKYRFRVTFTNFGSESSETTVLTTQIIDFKRPSNTATVIEMPVYNSIIKIPGKQAWADTSCKLRDDATGTVRKAIREQMQAQFDFANQASAVDASDYKFQIKLEILDGGNGATTATALETWVMYGCYIKKVSYGDLAYSESSVVEIALDIRFNNAVQLESGSDAVVTDGIGSIIGAVTTDSDATV